MSAVRDALSSIRRLGRSRPFTPDMRPLAMSKDEEAAFLANPQSDLETVFAKHQGRTVHKWVHYLPVYERAFAAYRGKKNLVLLEIGVSLGGSLEVWREYFGDNATIAGIDLDERCRQRFDPPNRVFIGSQADPDFLRKTVEEIGTPDIVIDDGSHVASHQRISFETLFPLLASDGVYIIEDTHTAYWKTTFEGGYRRPENIIEYCKAIVDDMHGLYHDRPHKSDLRETVGSISFHDSMIVINKSRVQPPRHVHLPAGARPAVDPII